jgi:hypothetical protein
MIRRCIALGFIITAPASAHAQVSPNVPYDGRVTLARLKYTPVGQPSACQGSDSPAGPGWGHDFPMSVQGLMTAAGELTNALVLRDGNVVLTVEDPEFMKHPVAMLTEPGCWNPTEKEVKALHDYLLKGGFLIVDDLTFFTCSDEHTELAIQRFETWIQRVLPGARPMQVGATDPIFDGFFQVKPEGVQQLCREPTQIMGIYKNNDPTKRLLVVSTYYNSLGEAWRYVDKGIGSGLEGGGGAYKLGLNYLIYGLAH